jgi:hypothetical protein
MRLTFYTEGHGIGGVGSDIDFGILLYWEDNPEVVYRGNTADKSLEPA